MTGRPLAAPIQLAAVGLNSGLQERSAVWGPIFVAATVMVWLAQFGIGLERSIALLSMIGFGAVAAGLFRPVIGLLGIGLLCTIDPLTRIYLMHGGLLRWNTLNYFLIGSAIFAMPVLARQLNRSMQVLVVLILLMVVGLTFSPEPMLGVSDLVNIAGVFGLLVLFARADRDREVILWVGLLNGTAAAVGGGIFTWQRMTGALAYINHNAFSYFPLAGMFSICLAYPLAKPKSRAQLSLLLLAVANLAWIYLSGSRGGLVSGLICLGYIIHRTRGVSAKWFGIVSALGIGLITVQVFGSMNDSAAERITKLFDEERSATNKTSGRTDLLAAGVKIFQEYPLGVGTGGFASAYARYLTGDLESDVAKISHSAWMKILVENGVLGACVLGVFVLSFASEGIRSRHVEARKLGIAVTLMLGFSFLTREFHGKALWFLAAGASYLISTRFRCLIQPIRIRVGWGLPERSQAPAELSPVLPSHGHQDPSHGQQDVESNQ